MKSQETAQLTDLLRSWSAGDATALERLTPRVYDVLRRIARQHMRKERAGHTLQTTALANEAYLRLISGASVDWKDRAHFFALCAQTMRRILVDSARARRSSKRGGHAVVINLDEAPLLAPQRDDATVAIHEALNGLAKFDARKAQVVELRYFGGLTIEEIAHVLNLSPQSVSRDWKLARAWLTRELNTGNSQ